MTYLSRIKTAGDVADTEEMNAFAVIRLTLRHPVLCIMVFTDVTAAILVP